MSVSKRPNGVRRRHCGDEEGASLLVAVMIVALLSVLGAMAMNSVHSDTEQVRATRSASTALYIAEAGVGWAVEQLQSYPYNIHPDITHSDSNPEAIAEEGTLADDARVCLEASPSPCQDYDWYYLDANETKSENAEPQCYNEGRFEVFARYEDLADEKDDHWIIHVRSIGISKFGARRLLEVQLGAP